MVRKEKYGDLSMLKKILIAGCVLGGLITFNSVANAETELESLHNLAQNGRVSKLSEIASRILGIRVIGQASIDGVLQVLSKCRGIKPTVKKIVNFILIWQIYIINREICFLRRKITI